MYMLIEHRWAGQEFELLPNQIPAYHNGLDTCKFDSDFKMLELFIF